MASTYTDLGLELMATGENAGTWGTKTNANLNLVEQIAGGYLEVSIAGGVQSTPLDVSDGALTGKAQNRIIKFTGAITGNQTVTLPVLMENFYIIENATTGVYTVELKALTGSGATVTWGTADKGWKILYADGVATNTGIYDTGFSTSAGDVTLTGVETLTNKTLTSPKINEDVAVTSTATELNLLDGVTSTTAELNILDGVTSTATELNKLDALSRGSIIYGNASAATTVLTKGTANQLLTSDGTDIAWQDAAASGLEWQTIITGSTLTAVAGRAYWINTTSNACTITLPSSASNGDQIILTDYARTWGTNAVTINTNGLNYQSSTDSAIYFTDGQTVNIVYSGATQGWIPLEDDNVREGANPGTPPQRAIFAYGSTTGVLSMSNLVNSSGVVATDVTGVGTARHTPAATSYGGNKAIFAFGYNGSSYVSLSNLVSGSGVIATDTTGVGTARNCPASSYGEDKGIFAFGYTGSNVSLSNLMSNSGVVATDTTGVGTARRDMPGAGYGTDKGIFAYGYTGTSVSISNKVSNLGVVASDTGGVGTARGGSAATTYGTDKALFGYGGATSSMTNLVSNTGTVASDTTGVGTGRHNLAAAGYGGDKAIFGYGYNNSAKLSLTNLVSNSGVVATDTTGVGTARQQLGAATYSYA